MSGMKEDMARELALLLAETDEATEFYEQCDAYDLYEMLEANGYQWYSGGWYTEEIASEIEGRNKPERKTKSRSKESLQDKLNAWNSGLPIR